jgi:hypothetical protein
MNRMCSSRLRPHPTQITIELETNGRTLSWHTKISRLRMSSKIQTSMRAMQVVDTTFR